MLEKKTRIAVIIYIHLTILAMIFIRHPMVMAHEPHDVVRRVAISPEFASDETVFISIGTTIQKSTNAGSSWVICTHGLQTNKPIVCMAVSPALDSDKTIFSGTNGDGIFSSSDGGESWVHGGLNGDSVLSIGFSPSYEIDQTVFAGTDGGGLYKSTDGGSNWILLVNSPIGVPITSIAISPKYITDQTIFVATRGQGIFKSADGGLIFIPLACPAIPSKFESLTISPMYPSDNTVFAGSSREGIYKTVDGGISWQTVNEGILDTNINDLVISPTYELDQTVFAATRERGVFRTTNGGSAWEPVNRGLNEWTGQTDNHWLSLAISSSYSVDQTIFLGAFEGLFKSINGADAWRQLNTIDPGTVLSIAISPYYSTDGTIFYTTYKGGIYKTQGNIVNWDVVNTGLTRTLLWCVIISPKFNEDKTIFSSGFQTVFRSDNAGLLWRRMDYGLENVGDIKSIVISHDFYFDKTLFAATAKDGVYKTTDGGLHWYPTVLRYTDINDLAISPQYSADQTVFAAAKIGVFKTTDGGITWQQIWEGSSNPKSIVISPHYKFDTTVFVGTYGDGVYKTTDGGATWECLSTGITDLYVQSMGISPAFHFDHTIFAGTKGSGLFKSTDRGQTWYSVGFGQTDLFMNCLSLSPQYDLDRILWTGGPSGVFQTKDNAQTWQRISSVVRFEETEKMFVLTGKWWTLPFSYASASKITCSRSIGGKIWLEFVGTGVSWIGTKGKWMGIAEVYIDGIFKEEVDLYAPATQWQVPVFEYELGDLGVHKLTIKVTGRSNPSSEGTVVILDAIDVLRFDYTSKGHNLRFFAGHEHQ
ncbi:MAG: hypothetical protein HF982_12950 [Desulfobacteraceae bacterium]|nr:hypothetical protein [Desulfobacteraceae bacterium]MBC2720467.1 hypothetical protein [Desulfobacteraceae bacterium]